MAKDEIPELRKLRDEYDEARRRLFAGIHKYLAEGHGPSVIARSVDWSREYIAKIRDGKVGTDDRQGPSPKEPSPPPRGS